MAMIFEMSKEQEGIWEEWKNERPQVVKALADRFKPNCLYLNKRTNQIVIPYSFSEDGTMTVNIFRKFNNLIFPSKQVFGVNPDNLEETDLPKGISLMTYEEYSNLD